MQSQFIPRLLIICAFLKICIVLPAQPIDTAMLCRGNYFTEEEGKISLQKFASTYHDLAGWEQRASVIRQGILKGMRLTTTSFSTPLKPIVHSKRTYDGYTVDNIAFESLPGIFVTGNLYRPTKNFRSYAAILAPHGHGKNPRFQEYVQKRCASLARMGAIVLAYDMIGYGESDQCEHKHPFAAKLQTINSIRAVDFLLTLDNVDPTRIGVSGESGGGTQSFLLTALDKRITVSVPVVMVSSYFFGGCICESGMPIHRSKDHQTSNVEIAALAAPRPMLLISDGKDWTKHTPEVEFPYIRNVYRLYDKENSIENVHLLNEGHDYGINKRKAAYPFLARHLNLSLKEITDSSGAISEDFVTVEPPETLKVFSEKFPRPSYAILGDDAVTVLVQSVK
jgi:dienelactone hydrolase